MTFDRATEDSIALLVQAFYAKVRADERLAPIFRDALGSDWRPHMARMCAFWGAAMRVSRRYQGDMLTAHRRLDGLRPDLFPVWLELFDETIEEHFSGDAGAALRERARKIARNLQLALFHRPGETGGGASRAVPGAIGRENA